LFVYVLISRRHDLSPWNSLGIADVLRSSVHEALFWLVAAFVLGALFAELPGPLGALKGATLALVYGLAELIGVWVLPESLGDWRFRLFELSLFLVVLGVLIDRRTLIEHGRKASELSDCYRLSNMKFFVGYASTAIGALVLIGQQLQSGHAQSAITQIIKNIPALLPPTH
jgi:hypothetical protein